MNINYWAIIVATLINFILGAIWYSPVLFGKTWMRIMHPNGINKSEIQKAQKAMGPFYILQLVLAFITNFFLYYCVIGWSGVGGLYGPVVALCVWAGFVAPTQISGVIWGSTPRKFWGKQLAIMLSYQLFALVIAGWLFGAW